MIKDIYIIKNKNNNKVYIGQSVNPKQRWLQYKSAAKHMPNEQLITKAMNKYGFDTFWMEILESNIKNYDEREKYWIQYYNSIAPNGYNIADGGAGSGAGIYSSFAAINTQQELDEIIEELITSNLTLKEIANKHQVSYMIINEINMGHTYFNADLNYPLRDSKKYSQEKLKQITYALRYELDKSLKDIAKEYCIDYSFLNDINQGKAYFREYLTYPLRTGKMKYQQQYLPSLIDDLKNTTISQVELAKKYKISKMTVSEVNTGKKGHQKDIVYPIRNEIACGRTCFSPNELQAIYKDLQNTTLSIRKIAEKYGISVSAMNNINNGKIKKYYDPQIKYPIRSKNPCIDYPRIAE